MKVSSLSLSLALSPGCLLATSCAVLVRPRRRPDNRHYRGVHRRSAAAAIGYPPRHRDSALVVNATLGAIVLLIILRLISGAGGGGWRPFRASLSIRQKRAPLRDACRNIRHQRANRPQVARAIRDAVCEWPLLRKGDTWNRRKAAIAIKVGASHGGCRRSSLARIAGSFSPLNTPNA